MISGRMFRVLSGVVAMLMTSAVAVGAEPGDLKERLLGLFQDPPKLQKHSGGDVSLRTPRDFKGIAFRKDKFKPGTKRYLILEMATEAKGTGAIVFNSGRRWFDVIGDRSNHVYNIDLYKGGKPQALTGTFMRFVDDPGAEVRIRRFELSDTPAGPPQVELRSAGLLEAINHPGSEREFFIHLFNQGGEDANALLIRDLQLPRGVTVCSPGDWRKIPPVKSRGYLTYTLKVRAARPVVGSFQIFLTGKGAPGGALRGQFEVTADPKLPKADYVPEPTPVSTKYEVGALYFPGWETPTRWPQIQEAAPERRPLLGYYDEANPEVIDWQIKWLVENGISFLLVDWYWNKGGRSHEHWVKSYDKTRYGKYLKWAIMWANHTPKGAHSEADQIAVTKYWIENYFNKPYYYRIDGRPVVVYWQSDNMNRDLGPGGAKKLLDISQKLAKEAGLPGIFFVAMKWPENDSTPKVVQNLRNQGVEMTSIYHYMAPGRQASPIPYRYDYREVAASNADLWERLQQTGILPFLPNLSTGWDDYPWHFNSGTRIVGRTPELFGQICRDAKTFADRTGVKRLVLAPLNEWGEGSYAEPNREYGFKMYEAVRDTFAERPRSGWPLNYGPEDVGLGPYPLVVKDGVKP